MEIIATGKNVEIAIQNGLLECGLTREEVEVKVIEKGGLFKNAKVQLSWGEQPKVEEKVEEPIEEIKEVEEPEEVKVETKSEQVVEKPKRIVNTDRLQKHCSKFLTGLVKLVDEKATVECTAEENQLSFTITGENLGKLIGFHGDNLKALQLLLSGLKQRNEGAVRIFLDINGYKSSKNQTLIDLANKTATQAINIERNIHLDPMSAYDRRIIHTALQGRDDVTTESTGEGEKRHVVVKPIIKR